MSAIAMALAEWSLVTLLLLALSVALTEQAAHERSTLGE
jgi:hypothetical protein